jgi:Bacterial dnaA protein helix-turn-helix
MRQHLHDEPNDRSAVKAMQRDARVRRSRLMAPPNAKFDPGIDLRRVPSRTTVPPTGTAGRAPDQRADTTWLAGIAAQLHSLQRAVADIRSILGRELTQAARPDRHTPSIGIIQQKVAEFFELSVKDLQSRRQDRTAVRARDMAFYLARELTGRSYSEIGCCFGNRHHTTVMHGHDRTSFLAGTDSPTKAVIGKLGTIIRRASARPGAFSRLSKREPDQETRKENGDEKSTGKFGARTAAGKRQSPPDN